MSEAWASFPASGGPVVVRPIAEGDEQAFVDCYNAVFPVDDPSVPRIDRELWDWKYSTAPSGGRREILVAMHPEAGMVGAYPCQPLRAWVDGTERRTSQITDLMVRHEWRRVGPRPGLFVHLGRAFYELYCGDAADRQVFNYGWPVPAWRVGQRFLRYENVRDWNFVAAEMRLGQPLRALPSDLEVSEVARFGAEVDALFARLRDGFGISLVKDAAYLNWRFAEHPRRDYALLECRERTSGALRAIAVYTVADFRRPNTSFLVDWLIDANDHDAMVAILGTCERRAFRDETGAIAAVSSPVDPRFVALQRLGWEIWDSGYFLVAAMFGFEMRVLRERWMFAMGDSDLV